MRNDQLRHVNICALALALVVFPIWMSPSSIAADAPKVKRTAACFYYMGRYPGLKRGDRRNYPSAVIMTDAVDVPAGWTWGIVKDSFIAAVEEAIRNDSRLTGYERTTHMDNWWRNGPNDGVECYDPGALEGTALEIYKERLAGAYQSPISQYTPIERRSVSTKFQLRDLLPEVKGNWLRLKASNDLAMSRLGPDAVKSAEANVPAKATSKGAITVASPQSAPQPAASAGNASGVTTQKKPALPTPAATTAKVDPASEKICVVNQYKGPADSWWLSSEAAARAKLNSAAANICAQRGGGNRNFTMAAVSCTQQDNSLWAQMKGIRPKQRPANDPPKIEYRCMAQITCAGAVKMCKPTGPVKATTQ